MNKILYYANFAVVPLLFVVYLVSNSINALKGAVRLTVFEIKSDYRSNKRYYKM